MKLPFVSMPRLRETHQRYLTGPARTLGQRLMLHSAHYLRSSLSYTTRCFPEFYKAGSIAVFASTQARRFQRPRLVRQVITALDDEKERE
jgi:hypothetical protein